jgi:hypothetical protein
MDHEEVGRFWNANADSWTKLTRAGYDGYRDYLNTPAFFDMLPNVAGLAGLVSQWLNLLIDTGFGLERVAEPRPSDATVRACPDVQDAQVAAYFLHIRVRKPEQATTSAGTRDEQSVAS